MLFSMPRIIQHSYNFFCSRTPKPKLWIFSSRTPNPKPLTAKLEGTGTNPRPRIRPQGRWASLLCITLPKRYYHLLFFNLPGLQKPGRNHFPKNSYWGIADLGILVSQNNLWTNSLIMVQGDCAYILLSSFSNLF